MEQKKLEIDAENKKKELELEDKKLLMEIKKEERLKEESERRDSVMLFIMNILKQGAPSNEFIVVPTEPSD